jgi:ATP/maltotriose-dependent transcriptional regulator MalT
MSSLDARDVSETDETVAALLSPREREALRLLAEGLSNKQMARRLNVSENTIKTHLANVYGKLGVNSRTQAIAQAVKFNLL